MAGVASVPLVTSTGIRVMGGRLGERTVRYLSRMGGRVVSDILLSQCLPHGPPITLFLNIARMQPWYAKGTHKYSKDRFF